MIGIDGLATDENFSNFVHSCSDVESQRRCQHLTNALGDMRTLMKIQPSRATMKTATACEQALHLRDIEKSHSRLRRKEVRAHSRVRLPLKIERFLQGITFLGGRVRSLFGEPVYVRNFEGKFELFTY